MGQFKFCTSGDIKGDWDVTGLQKVRQELEPQLAAFLRALLLCEGFGSCSILHRKSLIQSILTIKLCCTTASDIFFSTTSLSAWVQELQVSRTHAHKGTPLLPCSHILTLHGMGCSTKNG